MIRAVVVAPSLAMRAGLRALLGADEAFEVIAEAGSLAELVALPAGTDILISVAEGVEAGELRRVLWTAETAALLLLIEEEQGAVQLLPGLQGRIWGVLPLDCSAEELLAAVHALHEGLLVGAPALIEPLLGRLLRSDEAVAGQISEPVFEAVFEALTGREAEVLQLLAQGLANKQIATSLGISEHTVKFHVSSIYAKLGAASRTEAVRIGVRNGWVVL